MLRRIGHQSGDNASPQWVDAPARDRIWESGTLAELDAAFDFDDLQAGNVEVHILGHGSQTDAKASPAGPWKDLQT